MKYTFTLLCLLSFSLCFAQEVETKEIEKPVQEVKWTVLEDQNYSITYPENWEVNKEGLMGTQFILFSPLESEKDIFRENVNFIIQDLTGMNISLDKFAEISVGQISTLVTNAEILVSEKKKADSGVFYKTMYTGDQGVYHLQYEQYYWVVNEKAFILTFTAEQEKYADIKETGERILDGFNLTLRD